MISISMEILLYSSINILSLYTIDLAIKIFLKPEKKLNNYRMLSYLFFLLFGFATYFLNTEPATNILIQWFTVFIIASNYSGRYLDKFIISIAWVFLGVVSELIVAIIYGILMNFSVELILQDELSRLVGTILSKIVTLISIKLLQTYKLKKEDGDKFVVFDSFQVVILPICSIFIIYTFSTMAYNKTGIIQWLVAGSIVSLVFINIFVYYLFDKLKEIERVKYDNKFLKSQMRYYIEREQVVSNSFEKIRSIKHDLNYQLLYLKSRLEENTEKSLMELEDKLNFLIGEELKGNLKIYTKNQGLNRLLNYKLQEASSKGIETDTKVNVAVNAEIDEDSLYIILGNAIDNAIQNYSSEVLTQKSIIIRMFDDDGNLFIKISNPYSGVIAFDGGLPVTKKENPVMHGIGIKSIQELVKEQSGYCNITTINNIFCLEIMLYDFVK